MINDIKSVRITSKKICYGLDPSANDEVEQSLTKEMEGLYG